VISRRPAARAAWLAQTASLGGATTIAIDRVFGSGFDPQP
jgi:hypothetical protein